MGIFCEIYEKAGIYAPLFAVFDAVFAFLNRRDFRQLRFCGKTAEASGETREYVKYLVRNAEKNLPAERLCCQLYEILCKTVGREPMEAYRTELIRRYLRKDREAFDIFGEACCTL